MGGLITHGVPDKFACRIWRLLATPSATGFATATTDIAYALKETSSTRAGVEIGFGSWDETVKSCVSVQRPRRRDSCSWYAARGQAAVWGQPGYAPWRKRKSRPSADDGATLHADDPEGPYKLEVQIEHESQHRAIRRISLAAARPLAGFAGLVGCSSGDANVAGGPQGKFMRTVRNVTQSRRSVGRGALARPEPCT